MLDEDVTVIVAPYEWIFVEPPWHRGRVVLVGDAAHATAPTIGSAGGMAVEDAVVSGQELDSGLTSNRYWATTRSVGRPAPASSSRQARR